MLNPTDRRGVYGFLGKAIKWPVKRFVPPAIRARILPAHSVSISDATWNQAYGSGTWDYLGTTPEIARYSVIAGYCKHLKPAARVLDVGCGAGVLASWLSGASISSYFGIDLSEVAIEQARQANIDGAEFAVADAATFEPSQIFDVIVFNEMLYYLEEPEEQIRRLARCLAPGGLLIVSIWYHDDGIRTWNRLKAAFDELDRVRITHASTRFKWDVAVLKLR
ncbi:class I SAM-dependent methyltransferase [Burkholderia sp. JPY481]|uniref:class I SAM-dependent methyltransferase n=1 Tax=unclassified Paraburkholderia TaxID=2615204 RepID=UPI003175F779